MVLLSFHLPDKIPFACSHLSLPWQECSPFLPGSCPVPPYESPMGSEWWEVDSWPNGSSNCAGEVWDHPQRVAAKSSHTLSLGYLGVELAGWGWTPEAGTGPLPASAAERAVQASRQSAWYPSALVLGQPDGLGRRCTAVQDGPCLLGTWSHWSWQIWYIFPQLIWHLYIFLPRYLLRSSSILKIGLLLFGCCILIRIIYIFSLKQHALVYILVPIFF